MLSGDLDGWDGGGGVGGRSTREGICVYIQLIHFVVQCCKAIILQFGSEGKGFACKAGDLCSIPGSGRYPGEGNGNPLQYSFLLGEFHGHRNLAGYSPWGSQTVRQD